MPKKGKEGGKKEAKKAGPKELNIKMMAEVNADLWEARLEATDRARIEHREHARELALENEALQTQMIQTEKDTVEVVAYLKKQDMEKDKQMEALKAQIQDLLAANVKDKELLAEEHNLQIVALEQKLAQISTEAELLQIEMKLVSDFQRKRVQMQRELEEIRDSMLAASREHKENVEQMEQRFFEEKMKLQHEANCKIAELAEKAHSEAIANLNETTKAVYKENVRLNKAVESHIAESDSLRRAKSRLEQDLDVLRADKELADMLVQQKVNQSRHDKQLIKELQEKVSTLESSLSLVVREFDTEHSSLVERSQVETESAKVEVARLQRIVEMKSREMNRVKRLARNILDERTEIERFFLDSLELVKKEIASNRQQYRKDAEAVYQQRMLDAYMGKVEYPKVRTFTKYDNSTNSVFRDLESAERLLTLSGKVDISELTWEQRERVLRFLFAKMNAQAPDRSHKHAQGKHSAPPLESSASQSEPVPSIMERDVWQDETPDKCKSDNKLFLTEPRGDGTDSPGGYDKLPHISSTNLAYQRSNSTLAGAAV